jgi:hypothetical protein
MRSKRSLEGWLQVDNRESPGVRPGEIPAPAGSLPVGRSTMFESAVVTCSHCQTQVILNPDRSRPRNYCRKCDKYVCDNAACNMECVPYAALLDQAEKLAHAGRPHIIAGGGTEPFRLIPLQPAEPAQLILL